MTYNNVFYVLALFTVAHNYAMEHQNNSLFQTLPTELCLNIIEKIPLMSEISEVKATLRTLPLVNKKFNDLNNKKSYIKALLIKAHKDVQEIQNNIEEQDKKINTMSASYITTRSRSGSLRFHTMAVVQISKNNPILNKAKACKAILEITLIKTKETIAFLEQPKNQ